jgi:hypothetical protein
MYKISARQKQDLKRKKYFFIQNIILLLKAVYSLLALFCVTFSTYMYGNNIFSYAELANL